MWGWKQLEGVTWEQWEQEAACTANARLPNALENQGHLMSGAAAEETAETGGADGLCRCSCSKCQKSSSSLLQLPHLHVLALPKLHQILGVTRPRASRTAVPTPL